MMEKPTTEVAPGFAWLEGAAGPMLVCPALLRLAPHVFTTRGLSFRGPSSDDHSRRLAHALGLEADRLVGVRQVHGRRVIHIRPGDAIGREGSAPEADAIISSDPARAMMVRVADCVPILLADPNHTVVAAVHAGWRGTAAGVAAAAVEAIARLGIRPADLVAALGPSIGPCCYQVDAPVRDAFLNAFPPAGAWFAADGRDRWKVDLWQANVAQLVSAGLARESIHDARLCTAHHPDLCHSYRRDGAAAGRMVAAIRLRPPSAPATAR
jgi:hypothetical protein